MWFSVLGPLEVRDGATSLPLGGPRQRSVLALLLLEAGRSVPVGRLLTEIWGDEPPDGARDSLYTYVSNLRGALGRDRIVLSDGGYRLEREEGDILDAETLENGLGSARPLVGSDPESAIALIDESLSSWRGRPYEGFEDLPSIEPESARILELRLRALEDRIEAELRTGRTPEVGAVEALTNDHPYRERLWGLLARSLYRAGRQAESLRTLARLRRMLVDELGLDPSPEIARLEEQILVQDPALEPRAATPTNLPSPITSFIGRLDEIEKLERLVHEHRLVTVTGPGGAGKTRLAIEVAGRIAGSFPDGVSLVDLAQTPGPEGVVEAVTATLGIAGSASVDAVVALAKRLRPLTTLLVLDNCEHVIEAVGSLSRKLLSEAPNLHILATSRRALDTTGEFRFPLEGLGTTGSTSDAARLFEVRAEAVEPRFTLDAETGSAVASICRHLDGMPLAIEITAARADVLSAVEIDTYLRDRFLQLDDPHAARPVHRSLQASLDWSYEFLEAGDRHRFDLLGVFEGPFLASAAASMLDAESELGAVGMLRRLTGASLVQTLPGPMSRYRLLEAMRAYAQTHLGAGVWDEAVRRHDRHYRSRCRDLREAVFGRGRTEVRAVLESELADYEVAFDRFLETGGVDAALEMGWPLGHVWLFSGKLGRGIGRLERLISVSEGMATLARADTLTAAAFLLMYVARFEEATGWADEAIGIYRTIGDEQGLAFALARSGHLAFSVGNVPVALERLQESLSICGRIGYEEGTAWPLTLLAQARLWAGDESDEVRQMLEEGRRRFIATGDTFGQVHANMFIPNAGRTTVEELIRYSEESLELSDQPGSDPLIRPVALHNLAFAVSNAGEQERAAGLNRLSARAALEMGAGISSGMAFLQAGLFAGVGGDAERAAILYGAGYRRFVMQMAPFYQRQLQPGIDAATRALGEDEYRLLYEQGALLSVEEATEFLLGG